MQASNCRSSCVSIVSWIFLCLFCLSMQEAAYSCDWCILVKTGKLTWYTYMCTLLFSFKVDSTNWMFSKWWRGLSDWHNTTYIPIQTSYDRRLCRVTVLRLNPGVPFPNVYSSVSSVQQPEIGATWMNYLS